MIFENRLKLSFVIVIVIVIVIVFVIVGSVRDLIPKVGHDL